MAITLQVVGIFFNRLVQITGPATVKQVMDAARQQAASKEFPGVGAFAYTDYGGSVSAIGAIYTEKFQSRILGNYYDPGVYYIAEDLNVRPAYTVWQYYRLDQNGIQIDPMGKPVPYGDPAALVPDGGKVIWRLCSILAGPVLIPPVQEARLGLKAQIGDESTQESVRPLPVEKLS